MEDLFYYHKIKAAFSESASPERAIRMKSYMRNQFEFYGIDSITRRRIISDILRQNGKPDLAVLLGLTGLLWSEPHREMQYAAMDINDHYLKTMIPAYIPVYEKLIGQKSWWDSIDWLAPKAIGTLFRQHPGEIGKYVDKWMDSGNIWYIRSAILFQLHYKQSTDFELLKALILRTTGTREFFINKAGGWALREYSKTEPEKVTEFVQSNPELSTLTKTEALKWLKARNLIHFNT